MKKAGCSRGVSVNMQILQSSAYYSYFDVWRNVAKVGGLWPKLKILCVHDYGARARVRVYGVQHAVFFLFTSRNS